MHRASEVLNKLIEVEDNRVVDPRVVGEMSQAVRKVIDRLVSNLNQQAVVKKEATE